MLKTYFFALLIILMTTSLTFGNEITEIWQYKTGGEIFSNPVSCDVNGDGKIELIFGSNDCHIHVISGERGQSLWDYKTGDKITSSPAIADINRDGKPEIIVTSQDHFTYALKGADGQLLWKFDSQSWIRSSPAIVDINGDGKLEVVFGNDKGRVFLLDGNTGKEIWNFQTKGPVESCPAIEDTDGDRLPDIIITSEDKKIYSLKGTTGKEIWNFETESEITSSPITGDVDNDGNIEVIMASKSLYTLNNNGKLKWKFTPQDVIDGTPSMGDINNDGKIEIIFGASDNNLYAISGEKGELLWKQNTGQWIWTSPLIADFTGDGLTDVLITSFNEYLYIFNGKDGMMKGKYKLSGSLQSTPAIINSKGEIAVPDGEYKVHLLKLSSAKNILWGKFHGDPWNSGSYKNAISYGISLKSNGTALWGPEGYKIATVGKGTFKCSYKINDRQLGNGNGLIESGETAVMIINISNTGKEEGSNIKLKISSPTVYLSITPKELTIDRLSPGETKEIETVINVNGKITDQIVGFKLEAEGQNCEKFSDYYEITLSYTAKLPAIEIKKPFIADGKPVELSDGKITLEGIAKADNGIAGFEISSYLGKIEAGKNPDWTEKGPQAKGKKEYFFQQDINLKVGYNYISVRVIDVNGKEMIKEIPVIYTPKEGQRWAVVIGIGKYENPKIRNLNYSAPDAKSIYDYLISKGGFQKDHVKLLIDKDATLKEVKTSLGIFLREKAMKEDLVFIYYSGHGAPEIDSKSKDGDGLTKYIVTYDADPDNLYSTALPMDEITTIFDRITAEKIVFFIDSCYSGASGGKTFFKESGKAENISDNFLKQLTSGTGRIVITASSANEIALESEKLGHGIFTYYLMEALNGKGDMDKNGFITVDEIYQYLYKEVSRTSDNKQHPIKISKGQTEGDIILGKP